MIDLQGMNKMIDLFYGSRNRCVVKQIRGGRVNLIILLTSYKMFFWYIMLCNLVGVH
jgi:hypothetical protein